MAKYNITYSDLLNVDQFQELFSIIEDALNLNDGYILNLIALTINNTRSGTELSSSNSIIDLLSIIDNLTSTDTDKPLSSLQGKVLKGLIDDLEALLFAYPVLLYADSTSGTTGAAGSMPVREDSGNADVIKIQTYIDVTDYNTIKLLCEAKFDNAAPTYNAKIELNIDTLSDDIEIDNTTYAAKEISINVSSLSGIKAITVELNANAVPDAQIVSMRYASIIGLTKQS